MLNDTARELPLVFATLALFFFLLAVIQTLKVPEQIHVTEVELGGTVSLTCAAHGHEQGLFYWFKINYGFMVQTVAKGSFDNVNLDGPFISSRITVIKKSDVYSLTIRKVRKEDEATYFCQAGAAYTMIFVNGTYLAVKASHNELVYVKQSSDISSAPLGSTATLQCSLYSEKERNSHQCERSAFWFRAGSRSDPGLIYTHKTNCDRQANRSCVYQLSKTIHMPSDAGTYYCAVVTCGQILFGEGTKVETSTFLNRDINDVSYFQTSKVYSC
ncbi:uncharacterized protein LOC119408656 [Nematolebias whitei]|uniref:uncharacterized protein LOC119408656 n=1 Tax=Nematolebias whitei TaxID=451745 RepID=UPI00189A62E4|nr:uncharacterized protein LOC119408656 [Nematolebias whitei]